MLFVFIFFYIYIYLFIFLLFSLSSFFSKLFLLFKDQQNRSFISFLSSLTHSLNRKSNDPSSPSHQQLRAPCARSRRSAWNLCAALQPGDARNARECVSCAHKVAGTSACARKDARAGVFWEISLAWADLPEFFQHRPEFHAHPYSYVILFIFDYFI